MSFCRLSRRWLTTQQAFQLLGVKASASQKEIRTAYLAKAKIYHPDNQLTGDSDKFRELKQAADLLDRIKYQPEVKRATHYRRYQEGPYRHGTNFESKFTGESKRGSTQEERKNTAWENFFSNAGGGLVIVPFLVLFALMRALLFFYVAVKQHITDPATLEAKYDIKPEAPFLVQMATVMEYIRTREKYSFSNKQLFLDYSNHIRLKMRLIFLSDEDVLYIGRLCARNPLEAHKLLLNPSLLDNVKPRIHQVTSKQDEAK